MKPKFSFIIPTRNEAEYLPGCIESIKKQGRKDYEIIVADTLSDDGTKEIARRHGILVEEPRPGTGRARNTAAKHAKGGILIFADADVRFGSDFLDRLERKFSKDIGGGICVLRSYDGGAYTRKIYDWTNHIPRLLTKAGKPVTMGSCFVYRKEHFNRVGGFDPEFITNEDHELAGRMHKHRRFVFFHDISIGTSSRRIRSMGWFRLMKLYLKSSAVFLLRRGSLRKYG